MSLRSLILPSLAAIVVAVVALAFKTGPSPGSTASASAVVSGKTADLKISNYAYKPVTLTVKVGAKITVTNSDQTAHTATARSGGFDSGTVDSGKSRSFTVTKPGVYQYFCQFHAFMSGTIKVIR